MGKKVHIYIRDEERYEALKKSLGSQSFSSWVEEQIRREVTSRRMAADLETVAIQESAWELQGIYGRD